MVEQWNTGMMGWKEFFTIKIVYSGAYPQYSNIPVFHHSIEVAQTRNH